MGADSSGRLAFDIETINAERPDDEEMDAQNSEHVEFFCVCVAHQTEPGTDPHYEIIFREGNSAEDELKVIEQTLDYLETKPPESVLTYNGNEFDLPHLEGRAQIAAETIEGRFDVAQRAEEFVDNIESIDLMPEACDFCGDEYTSFENICETVGVDVTRTPFQEYDFDIDVVPHRPTWKGIEPYMMGCDIPLLGERYLNFKRIGATNLPQFQELREAIKHYATTDVIPLFELNNKRPFSESMSVSN
ncbi:3'-5' exonuclease [Halostagnicola bangensis]